MKLLKWILVVLAIPCIAQDVPSLESLREKVGLQYDKVNDYSVRVKMSVKMPKFRMPRKRIKLYFKKPEKIKIESDGFAVVPKSGLTMSPDMFFKHLDSTTVSVAEDGGLIISGRVYADSLDFPIAAGGKKSPKVSISIHVKTNPWIIDRVFARVDTMTVFAIQSEYEEVEKGIWLPILTEMNISFPKLEHKIPEEASRLMGLKKKPSMAGKITIRYSKYKVNRGIKDSFFDDAGTFFKTDK